MTGVPREFEEFFVVVEPRLRAALVARYGATTGRAVTIDALSYAWEHWHRLSTMDNPVGYLFRVGQSASRAYMRSDLSWTDTAAGEHHDVDVVPELRPALDALPEQQRAVVVLVHGLGWTHRQGGRHARGQSVNDPDTRRTSARRLARRAGGDRCLTTPPSW